jgi:fibronectin-binding autotransporter adhesin
VINNGTLKLGRLSGIDNYGALRGTVTVNAGATLDYATANTFGYDGTWQVNELNIVGGTVGGADFENHFWNSFVLNMTGGTLKLGGTGTGQGGNEFQNVTITVHPSASQAVIQTVSGNEGFDVRSEPLTFDVGDGAQDVDLLVDAAIYEDGGDTLIKQGPGTMALTKASNMDDLTTIREGTLQLGHGGTTGSLNPASSIVNSGVLAFDRSNTILQGADFGTISGSGDVHQRGSGTVLLTTGNPYSGNTTITDGILNAGSVANAGVASSIGAGTVSGLVINGGTFQYDGGPFQSTDRVFAIGPAGATLDASGGRLTLGSAGGTIPFLDPNSPAQLTLTGSGQGDIAASLPDSNPGSNVTSLIKTGSGTWALSAANTFSGTTDIQNGALYLNGANMTPVITVASGATLGGAGAALSATTTVSNAGIIEAGSDGLGALALHTLTFISGGTVEAANIGNYSNTPAISVTSSNGLTLSGGVASITAALSGDAPPPGFGTAHLMQYNGSIGGGFDRLILDTSGMLGLGDRSAITLVDNPPYVDISYGVDFPIWSGADNGEWVTSLNTNAAPPTNWRLAASPALSANFVIGDAPHFDDSATGVTTVVISTVDVMPSSVIFDNSVKDYTLEGAFGIAGVGPVVKRGSGALTMSNNNSFSGPLSIEDGTLVVTTINDANVDGPLGNSALPVTLGSDGANGTLQYEGSSAATTKPFTMAADGVGLFDVDSPSTLTLSGVIDGGGGLTKTGDGGLSTSGANTYGGATIVSAGTLQFEKKASLYNGATASWTAERIRVESGTTLAVNAGGVAEFSSGDIDILASIGSFSGGFQTGSFFGIDTRDGDFSHGSVISDPGGNILGLKKLGDNTLTLSSVNTYTGGTIVDAGILNQTVNNGIRGSLTINRGATFTATAQQILYTGNRGPVIINGGTLDSNNNGNNNDVSFTSVTMTGGLWTHTGSSYFDIFNNNIAPLPITTLASTNEATISASRINTRGNIDLLFTVADGTTPSGADLVVSALLTPKQGSGSVSKNGPGVMAFTVAETYTGTTTINDGTLQLGNGGTTGSLHLDSEIVNHATLAFKRSDDLVQGVDIRSDLSGSGRIAQIGSGTVFLNGNNTYAGPTLIQNGILNVDALANVNTASAIGMGSVSGSADDLIIDGGTLQYTGGAPQTTDRLFTIGANGATIDASGGLIALGSAGGDIAFEGLHPAQLHLTGSREGILAASLGDSGATTNITTVMKTGADNWTLAATNTYTGDTIIDAGTLYLNGDNATTNITVAPGATLGGSGAANGAVTSITTGATVEGGSNGAGTLTLEQLNVATGGVIKAVNIGSYAATPAIHVTGNDGFTVNGGPGSVTVALSGLAVSGSGTVHILQYTGSLVGGFSSLKIDTSGLIGLGARSTVTLVDNPPYVDVQFNVEFPVWSGANDDQWITSPSTNALPPSNWRSGANPAFVANFVTNDAAHFDDTATGVTAVAISTADVYPSATLVDNSSKSYTLDGPFGIAGNGDLIKLGTGRLTIANTNSFSGQVKVEAGELALSTINNANSNGPLGNSALPVLLGNRNTPATLIYSGNSAINTKSFSMNGGGSTGTFQIENGNATLSLGGAIDGNGSLTKRGAGALSVSGINTYAGVTTIANGMLHLGQRTSLYNANTARWTPTNIKIAPGTALALNVGVLGEFTTADLDIIAAMGSASGGFASGSTLVLDTRNGDFSHATAITDPGGNVLAVTKSGSESLTLQTATSTYTGGTIVDAGTLILNGGNGGGNGTIRGALTVNVGATMTYGKSNAIGNGNGTSVNVLNIVGGTVGGSEFGQHFWNNFQLNMTGGTLLLGGNYNQNEFHNPTITIHPSDTTAHIIGVSGDESFDLRSVGATFNVADGSNNVDVLVDVEIKDDGGTTITKDGAGTMRFTAANTYSGITTLNDGVLELGDGGTSGALNPSATIVNDASLHFNRSDDVTQGIDFGTITGTGSDH